MKCSQCRYDNPESVKFCGNCGSRIEKICSNCGTVNPPQFKFCGECGREVSSPSRTTSAVLTFDQMLAKIQGYLPEGLTEKILSQKERIQGEKRQVTVLFCDMENFTALSERIGPEGVYALMDQIYEILIHAVNAFEGTVNEMTGDGIMALFGAPIALEDTPQRAVRAALSIHREITRFSERVGREKGYPHIRMRIEINSGPVVVGAVGNDLRVEFKAVGDTVNLASRLQDLAEPGTTYISSNTFKLTDGFFCFEPIGEKRVKGKAQPIGVYRVIAPSSKRTRFEVNAERGLTPIVGRSRELDFLLNGVERAKEGYGQAFSIIGEAGIGKSRLLYEFKKALANENVTYLEGRCLSYGRGSAYHPISDILKGAFGIDQKESPAKIENKVQIGLEALKVSVPRTLPFMLELLGVRKSGIEQVLISPEGKKDRIIETLKHIVLKSSEIRPIIIAVEDLHWADKSTERVISAHGLV